jgi:hypothetical protein
MDKLKKNKEVNIVAKEYGRVNVIIPINATDEEIEEATIQAESEGMASFFKREITVLGNNPIQECIKQFTVGKTVYTLSKAPSGQYCLSGDGKSKTGNAEDIMVEIINLFALKEDEIYRQVKCRYVADDAADRMKERGIEDPDDSIRYAVAERYVLDGDYDCNLDYWANIDNLINQILEICK